MITGLYAGILGLIYLGLCALVIKMRFKHEAGIGDKNIEEMQRAVRVHGNFAEYVPLIVIMMAVTESTLPYSWSPFLLHGLGIAMVIARVAHAYGLSKSIGTSPGRFLGTIATFVVLMILSIALITQFLIA